MMWKKYQSIPLIYKMVTGMVLGILAGWSMGPDAVWFQPLGKFFLTCLKCIAMPLVIVNLIAGISNLDSPESFGRIGGRIIFYYIATSAVAMVVGMVISLIIQPGVNLPLEGTYKGVVGELPTISSTLLALIPGNVFKAMMEGRFDQIVFVSAVTGIALLLLPEAPRKRLATFFQDMSDLMGKVVSIVMILAPYGIFALIAVSVGKYGSKIFGTLAKYIGSVYLGIFAMCCLYATLVFLFTRITPREFFRKASRIMVTAFSTCSSTSSIPINMACAESLGAPKKVYSFTIPLGAQINKDGTCVCLTTVFIMTAQAIGAPLDLGLMLKVLILGLILTTGSGAVPSGMLVILAILLESLGFPLEIVGLVAGVHAFNDMGMTMINCLGDLAGTVIVGNAEKKRISA
ncbi:MAG: dicarboxylate/amino acid:cation symporter [Acidaminococcus fermentans]|nr:dicarboxylate/amino acid:cation symporter [Acidaminococcus fermentans]